MKQFTTGDGVEKYYVDIDGAPSSSAFTLKVSPIRISDKTITGDPEKGVNKVAFDRSGYRYHGRVKALADSARENGLTF